MTHKQEIRITVLAAGSRGDVQPYLAMAVGLKKAGYQVRFASHSNFSDIAADYELDFFPINIDAYEVTQSEDAQKWLESTSVIKLVLNTTRIVKSVLAQLLTDTFEASKNSDLLIYHSFTLPFIYHFGKYLKIPSVPASIYPLPTVAHPVLTFNLDYNLGRYLNRFSFFLVDQFTWQIFHKDVKNFLAGKASVSFLNPMQKILKEGGLVICGYSPVVIPRPEDLPASVVIVGYWFLENEESWQPSPDLVDFLKAGSKPVYIGFGSMRSQDPEETTRMILEAVTQTGVRAIIASGWTGLKRINLPKNVFMLESAPHTWLFQQMAAVVHHGGAGTTAEGLRSGSPSILIPHFGDQFFWGFRIKDLGVGPTSIRRKKLNADRLANAISSAMHDVEIQENARKLGKRINQEDGVSLSVKTIQQYLRDLGVEQ